jgi:hypothetical protein
VRFFGGLLLVLGAGAGAVYGFATPLGAVLYRLYPPFLNTLQAGIQRNLSPELWDSVLLPLLEWPVWVLPAVLGLLFLLLGWRRRM